MNSLLKFKTNFDAIYTVCCKKIHPECLKKSHKWDMFNVFKKHFDFTGANTMHGFILRGDKVNVLIVCKRL